DLPVLYRAQVPVGVAGQPRAGVARHRGVGRPPRRAASARRKIVARGDVHPPDLLPVVRPDLAGVWLVAHGRIITTPARLPSRIARKSGSSRRPWGRGHLASPARCTSAGRGISRNTSGRSSKTKTIENRMPSADRADGNPQASIP